MEILLKLLPGHLNTVFKRLRTILGNLNYFSYVFELCALMKLDLSKICSLKLVEVLWIKSEQVAEEIFCPLNAMQCFFREHLQCAVRDRQIFLWVCLGGI